MVCGLNMGSTMPGGIPPGSIEGTPVGPSSTNDYCMVTCSVADSVRGKKAPDPT